MSFQEFFDFCFHLRYLGIKRVLKLYYGEIKEDGNAEQLKEYLAALKDMHEEVSKSMGANEGVQSRNEGDGEQSLGNSEK